MLCYRKDMQLLRLYKGLLLGFFCVYCSVISTFGEEPRLRVLTYNIHHAEGMDGRIDYERLATIISRLEPDVVALQEVDRSTTRSDGVDQLQRLASLTGMNGEFGRAMYYANGEYGEGILSRFPIVWAKAHPLPFRPGEEPRAALAALVKPDNGLPSLVLVGTHLCHQSETTRVDQVRHLNALFAEDLQYPVILAGDLNARPNSDPINILKVGGWVDATAPKSVIDYVLIRSLDHWEVVDTEVVDDKVASDHPAVLVELRWRSDP